MLNVVLAGASREDWSYTDCADAGKASATASVPVVMTGPPGASVCELIAKPEDPLMVTVGVGGGRLGAGGEDDALTGEPVVPANCVGCGCTCVNPGLSDGSGKLLPLPRPVEEVPALPPDSPGL